MMLNKKRAVTYTHKGWIGICPVYIGGIAEGAWYIDARRWWLEPLHDFSIAMYRVLFFVMEMAGKESDGFPIRITAKLPEPLTVTMTTRE